MHWLNGGKVSGGDTIVIGKLPLIVSVAKLKLCISLYLEVVVMLLGGLVKYPTKGKACYAFTTLLDFIFPQAFRVSTMIFDWSTMVLKS